MELYKSGLSLQKISSLVGIPRETVRISLHRLGVKMRHELPVYCAPRPVLDPDSALLLGLHAGDGWISDKWGIAVHSTDTKMVIEVIGLVRSVLAVEPGVSINKDHVTAIWSAKRQAIDYFLRYGFPAGKKSAIVAAPRSIFASSLEVKRAFLRGLFSADGCFYKEGLRGECRFDVASLTLRNDFVTLASDLGFEHRCYSYTHRGGHNKLPLHTAYLGRQTEVKRWMEEVGSICDSHMDKFRNLMESIQGSP